MDEYGNIFFEKSMPILSYKSVLDPYQQGILATIRFVYDSKSF
jgi:hypothetical protein